MARITRGSSIAATTDMLRTLSNAGADARNVDELRRLAAGIRASDFSGNPDILAQEARQALSLVEQLELRLARTLNDEQPGIRSNAIENIPDADPVRLVEVPAARVRGQESQSACAASGARRVGRECTLGSASPDCS